MDEEAILKIAAMVKVVIVAGLRESVKAGESIDRIIDRYEYASFAFNNGDLIMISAKRDASKINEKIT